MRIPNKVIGMLLIFWALVYFLFFVDDIFREAINGRSLYELPLYDLIPPLLILLIGIYFISKAFSRRQKTKKRTE